MGAAQAISRAPRAVAAAVLALVTVACGFQLQGRTRMPPALAVTYVEAENEQSDFVQDLRRALAASGSRLASSPKEATAVVRVLRDEVTERVLSVSARNIPREYELTYAVRFSVQAGEKVLLEPQDLAASRDISFDERLVLAKEREEEILRGALARDLVGIAMRRLASL